jgi:N-acetylglucosaminyldiphosphoundecaprenol N-acetyl-beta-D-mannosaminyltransferase
MEIVNLLNVSIHNITIKELLEELNHYGGFVVTPNIDHLVKLQTDKELLKAYYHSNYRVCDSKILQYISALLGNPIEEKISGSDLFPAFYEYNKDNLNTRIFLLGGEPGVARQAQANINQKVGRNIVIDAYSPSFGFEKNERECEEIVDRINRSNATVLAIGVGAPKQEKWIDKYKTRLENIKIFLAIGATIDFEAGHKSRSPQWMSEMGVEWLYRLSSEPSRLWKRYLVDSIPVFWLVGKQKFNQYKFSPLLQANYLPLGELLQQAGLLNPQEIRYFLRLQEQHHQYRFGEILVEQKRLRQATIDFFVNDFPQLVKTQDLAYNLRLGDYLDYAGLIDRSQIQTILRLQSQTSQKFGQIILQQGLIEPRTLDWFVDLQHQLTKTHRPKNLNRSGFMVHS